MSVPGLLAGARKACSRNRYKNSLIFVPKPERAVSGSGLGRVKTFSHSQGQTRKCPAAPWSPEFMAAREQALNGEWQALPLGASRTKPGTVNATIVSYYQSAGFKEGLATTTQKNRRAILERFREEHGDKRVALMHKTALQIILNKKTAAAAKNWVKALRGWVDHCISLEMVKTDPLIGLKLVKVKSKPHRPWKTADIEQYKMRHPPGTRERLALE
jgi:hypothetical protein